MHSWANLVIIMLAHQISGLACQINTWSWSWIVINIQLIMSVNVSITLWLWNTINSYNLSEFLQKIWILQVLIIIVQNIILLQAVSCHKSYNLIQQYSVFMKNKQLSIIHYSCYIVRAYFLECDLTNQFWKHIQNWNQNK